MATMTKLVVVAVFIFGACGGDDECVAGTACQCNAGDSCDFECPGGNCAQQCNGDCTASCEGGNCTQQCAASNATCSFTCEGGGCVQQCNGNPSCTTSCVGTCTGD